MTSFTRWLRGALGIGLTWATLWVIIGVLIMTTIYLIDPADIGPGEGPAKALPILAAVGLLSGFGFATLLSLAEGRRGLRDLSMVRVALWGALGSAAIPFVMGTDASMGWLTGSLGAIFAAGSLALARRGEGARIDQGDEPIPAEPNPVSLSR